MAGGGRRATTARPVIFGEVLFDRFPDGSVVLGGAPLNVAWNLRGLGLDPLLISRVGDDELGERIRGALEGQGLDTSGVQVDPAHPTGTVEVRLDQGQPSFEIIDGCAYDYIEDRVEVDLSGAGLLYCGSLALRGEVSRGSFEGLLARSGLPLLVDLNLRDPWWHRELIEELLSRARYAKLNEEELARLSPGGEASESAAAAFFTGHDLDLLCVTRGAAGAACWTRSDGTLALGPEGTVPVVDTVGAGDAFSAVLLAGLLLEWPVAETMRRAQELAAAVVGIRGATSSRAEFYARFIRRWSLE